MLKFVAAVAVLAAPVAVASGCANQSTENPSTTTTSAPNAQALTTQLNTADGRHVANATIDFTGGYATVTVETAADGALTPGFHGLHIHAVGTCEGDFASAGEHFQAPGHTGQPASGDLPPLLVRSDGAGKLVATTDGFTQDQLKGPQGSSIVLHETAESDQRIACGVLSPATATGTSVSTRGPPTPPPRAGHVRHPPPAHRSPRRSRRRPSPPASPRPPRPQRSPRRPRRRRPRRRPVPARRRPPPAQRKQR
ncbi:superoxide dismutase family protein [Mycobacterium sp. 3519A]|uniref:superoxide dismutase family protein n=1 Tax=Mycobacterium sp. 3519A TaxID=2057184 RepID=UPI003518EDE3